MDEQPTPAREQSQPEPVSGYRFDRCDECHGPLAEADRLSGICPPCEEMIGATKPKAA